MVSEQRIAVYMIDENLAEFLKRFETCDGGGDRRQIGGRNEMVFEAWAESRCNGSLPAPEGPVAWRCGVLNYMVD